MNTTISKEVKILSLSFLFIFLGYNGVQQYITTFFSEARMINVGFRSLILVYLFLMLFNPLAAISVSKYGAKRCMLIASVFYFLFIVSLLAKSTFIIYFFSILLGIAGSLLWTGANSYLIRASNEKIYGASSGLFNSFLSLGSALGVVILGFLISKFLFNIPFLIFSLFPLVAFFLLFKLKDIRAEQVTNHFKLIKKSVTSITALKLSSIWFVVNFSYGLVIGIIPIEIKNTLGLYFVGILSSLFYVLPIILSYFFGKLSDIRGRKMMIIFSYILSILGILFVSFSGQALLLIMGVVLLAFNSAIMKPITYALVGDVSTKDNLEFLTALFLMAQSIGIVIALFISQVFQSEIKIIYYISIFAIALLFLVIAPLLRIKTEKIKEKISQEMS
jgi:MFS family permease